MRTSVKSFLLDLPIRTVSTLNERGHWRTRHQRGKAQRKEIEFEWRRGMGKLKIELPCTVTFTRIGPRLLDLDNLQGSMKAVRDQVAEMLGADDSPSSPITWEYRQERGKFYRILIAVESKGGQDAGCSNIA